MVESSFKPCDPLQVRDLPVKGHMRTPDYIRGRKGRIETRQVFFPNPERLAYGADGLPAVPLYLVRFPQSEIWPGYDSAGDSLALDIFEHWLEPAES